jgi:hypothetical protein
MAEQGYSMLMNDIRKNYNTFSGADISLYIGGVEIGTAMSIALRVARRKEPIYTFGSPTPRGIGRGIRQIAGTLENVSLKISLLNELQEGLKNDADHWIAKKRLSKDGKSAKYDFYSNKYEKVNENMNALSSAASEGEGVFNPGDLGAVWDAVKPVFLDELLPIDIVLISVNEFGVMGRTVIRGAEFVTQDWAMDINSVSSVERVEFLARDLDPFAPIETEQQIRPDNSPIQIPNIPN